MQEVRDKTNNNVEKRPSGFLECEKWLSQAIAEAKKKAEQTIEEIEKNLEKS